MNNPKHTPARPHPSIRKIHRALRNLKYALRLTQSIEQPHPAGRGCPACIHNAAQAHHANEAIQEATQLLQTAQQILAERKKS